MLNNFKIFFICLLYLLRPCLLCTSSIGLEAKFPFSEKKWPLVISLYNFNHTTKSKIVKNKNSITQKTTDYNN